MQVARLGRSNRDELPGIKRAMDFKLRDDAPFWAQPQKEPPAEVAGGTEVPDAGVTKVKGHVRGEVPVRRGHPTAYVDVGQDLLFYAVCAWEADFLVA